MVESEADFILRGFNTNPLILSKLFKSEPEKLNSIFPYSVGMEIETVILSNIDLYRAREEFTALGLLHVDLNKYDEQRFRFKEGFEGAVQLYKASKLFYKYLMFNEESGIHYHIDFTDTWNLLDRDLLKFQETWILPELDTWDYKGQYNLRKIGSGGVWLRWNDLKTLEFRIGNMEFEYSEIIKRILSAQMISAKLKIILKNPSQNLKNLQEKLVSLNSEPESQPTENWEEVVKSRVTKIN